MKWSALVLVVAIAAGCQKRPGSPSANPISIPSSPVPTVNGGTDVGNGGDHVRSQFIKMGEAVLKYLEESPRGQELVRKEKLDIASLRRTLSPSSIKLSDGPLIDNKGSAVDALGVGGLVTLHNGKWLDHFEKERDVYHVVLHEMCRSSGIDDDDRHISKELNPFPKEYKITTRIAALIPLIDEDLLYKYVAKNGIKVTGSSLCGERDTFVEFDAERNILEINFTKMSVTHKGAFNEADCHISIPLRAPDDSTLSITQVDIGGQVFLPIGTMAAVKFETVAPFSGEVDSRLYEAITKPYKGRFLMRFANAFEIRRGKADTLKIRANIRVKSSSNAPSLLQVETIRLYLYSGEAPRGKERTRQESVGQ